MGRVFPVFETHLPNRFRNARGLDDGAVNLGRILLFFEYGDQALRERLVEIGSGPDRGLGRVGCDIGLLRRLSLLLADGDGEPAHRRRFRSAADLSLNVLTTAATEQIGNRWFVGGSGRAKSLGSKLRDRQCPIGVPHERAPIDGPQGDGGLCVQAQRQAERRDGQ